MVRRVPSQSKCHSTRNVTRDGFERDPLFNLYVSSSVYVYLRIYGRWHRASFHTTRAMSYTTKVSLRILYTINNSPQYILARSQAPVPVSPVFHSPDISDSNTLYATVNLKTCLETIARSSPELAQDTSRDFSVYVLDPLESNSAPAPVHISNTTNGEVTTDTSRKAAEQPRGVAVGFGLMSLALQSPEGDTTSVAGTLVRQGSPLEALEVIFALREVCIRHF